MTPRLHAWTHPSTLADGRAAAFDRLRRRPAPASREAAGGGRRTAMPVLAAALAGMVLLPATAAAQVGGYVNVNGGSQATSTSFTDNVALTLWHQILESDEAQATSTGFGDNVVASPFHEDADFNAAYAVGTGRVFDGGGGVRLANGLGFGIGVSRFNKLDPASIDARIPHPFVFNRPRSLSGSEPDLTRMETAVHVEVRWFQPVSDTVEVAVFGGPTFFNLQQDLVTGFDYGHAYPYNEPSFTSATTTPLTASAVGFHAGADVGFFFSEVVGVGALLRYSAASVELPFEAGAVTVDAGGLHFGAGLRLRF